MRALRIVLAAGLLGLAPAQAASTSGPYALALAGVLADRDPFLGAAHRHVVAALFAGATPAYPPGQRIVLRADKVVCRVSNVQIVARSCQLSFRGHAASLSGRAANEIFATLAAAGVASDGAAGSIYEAVHGLVCTLTPSVIRQNAGGGASCVYTVGP